MTNDTHINIEKLTLDTHVLIWYSEGTNLSKEQVNIIEQVRKAGNLYISAISIWEIAMLVNKDKIALSISLDEWIDKLLSTPGLNLIDLSISILTQSCVLPKYEYKDPADRLIIASVRYINSHLMTFDQKVIGYADNGYLKVIK
ncbi:type II toxin-antitoxin system VapC family toxin [Candidatus Tisiphia endosymbiont of Ceraclea dissimilis]|uniref:type II toxin-antitoxin system VapC family toxin n=1 Tax=Candidatus Tisiphia endosymbiont of Ceraclea dissimilis TaxID=3077928 RepID=UPI003CCAFD12